MAELILSGNATLDKAALSCAAKIESLGYSFPKCKIALKVARPSRRLGCCHFKHQQPTYISVNQSIIENPSFLMQTVYHEMIHAILPYSEHHGYKWQKIAAHISKETGLNITRTTSTAELGDNYIMSFKHVYRCKKCGKLIGRGKLPRWDRYLDQTTHINCGGTFEKIK